MGKLFGLGALGDFAIGVGNLFSQRRNRRWNINAQRTTWNREDTAVQRRVADLRAAGLSPTLAAGSAAQTSPAMQQRPVQYEGTKPSEAIGAVLGYLQTRARIDQTKAGADAARANAELARTRNEVLGEQHPLKMRQMQLQNELNTQLNPQRIQSMALDLKRKGVEITNRELDQQLKQQGLRLGELNIAIKEIARQIEAKNLTLKEKEIIAKEIAINLARYTYKTVKDRGLVPGASSPLERVSGGIVEWIRDATKRRQSKSGGATRSF